MERLEYIREFRVFNYAIFDLIVSFGGIYLLSPRLSKIFLKINIKIPKRNWLFLTLPIGMLFHLIFSSSTAMTSDLFDPNGFYILKALMLVLIVLGFWGIKRVQK